MRIAAPSFCDEPRMSPCGLCLFSYAVDVKWHLLDGRRRSPYHHHVLALALFASVALAAESPCRPDFPYRDGWLGADAAYSVPLADGRSLWLFGDTFVGAEGARDRSGSAMISNSIALSSW